MNKKNLDFKQMLKELREHKHFKAFHDKLPGDYIQIEHMEGYDIHVDTKLIPLTFFVLYIDNERLIYSPTEKDYQILWQTKE